MCIQRVFFLPFSCQLLANLQKTAENRLFGKNSGTTRDSDPSAGKMPCFSAFSGVQYDQKQPETAADDQAGIRLEISLWLTPHVGSNPTRSAMKKALLSTRQKRFFQRNPSLTTGEIHLRWVKSRCDEIPLRGVTDGFHFTVRQRRTISPKASAFDFTEAEPRFHCCSFRFHRI